MWRGVGGGSHEYLVSGHCLCHERLSHEEESLLLLLLLLITTRATSLSLAHFHRVQEQEGWSSETASGRGRGA